MANDNTLGAPTEGLGQTVTFASGQRAGVPQTTAMQRGSLRNSATGGAAVRTAQALQVTAPKGDTLFQTLARLGGDLIKPQLEAERTLKYVEGMQKAASGQAIEEIVNEQPFFSGLFGSSSVVDGARAYSASAKATSMAVDFETNMGELRKLSPTEMSKYTAGKIAEATSGGDAATNAMIVQQVGATLPAVMKGQTKAHIRYQQELRETATEQAYDAGFALLQVNAAQAGEPGATKTVDDVMAAGVTAMSGMVRDSEIQPALHSRLVAQSAAKSIMGGNLRAMYVMEQSGKLAELEADDQYKIKRAYSVAQAEAKTKLPVEFYTKVLEFKQLSMEPEGKNPAAIQAAADAINNEYRKLKGDHGDYLDPRDIMGEQMQLAVAEKQRIAALEREAKSGATHAIRQQAAQDAVRDTFALAMDPAQGATILVGKKPAEVEAVMAYARNAIGGTKEHAFFIAQQSQVLVFDNDLKQLHSQAVESAATTGDGVLLDNYYTKLYKPLVEAAGGRGEVVAQQYAGAQKDAMARYHKLRMTVPNPTALELSTFAARALAVQPEPAPSGKRNDAVLSELKDNAALAFLGRGFGGDTVPLENPEGFKNLIYPLLSKELPVDQAIELAKSENRDIVQLGGTYWTKRPGQTRLDDWLLGNTREKGAMNGQINQATKLAISTYAGRVGIEGTPTVVQLPDIGKVPHMALFGVGADNKPRITYLTGEEVHSTWATRDANSPEAKAVAKVLARQAEKAVPEGRLSVGKITQ
jgi:hypothetical protein